MLATMMVLVLQETHDLSVRYEPGERALLESRSTGTMEIHVNQGGRQYTVVQERETDRLGTLVVLSSEGVTIQEARIWIERGLETIGQTMIVEDREQPGPTQTTGSTLGGCVFRLVRDGDPEAFLEEGEPTAEDQADVDADVLDLGDEAWLGPDHPVAVGDMWAPREGFLEKVQREVGSFGGVMPEYDPIEGSLECRLESVEEAEGRTIAHVRINGTVIMSGRVVHPELFGDEEHHPVRMELRMEDARLDIDVGNRHTVAWTNRGTATIRMGSEEDPVMTIDMTGESNSSASWE